MRRPRSAHRYKKSANFLTDAGVRCVVPASIDAAPRVWTYTMLAEPPGRRAVNGRVERQRGDKRLTRNVARLRHARVIPAGHRFSGVIGAGEGTLDRRRRRRTATETLSRPMAFRYVVEPRELRLELAKPEPNDHRCVGAGRRLADHGVQGDRKSTRLNSS